MADGIQYGSFTKIKGGLCYSCYKKSNKIGTGLAIKEKPIKPSKEGKPKMKELKENPLVSGVVKGRIAENHL